MWALVKEDKIEEIYYSPKSIILDNVRYPSNMFTLYTTEEKKRIHIYDIKEKDRPTSSFYNIGPSSYSWDSDTNIVSEDFTITEKDISELNYRHKETAKDKSYREIGLFSWLVERYIYDNTKTIPNEVVQYVAAIRSHCNDICIAVDNCNTINDCKTLYENLYNEDGKYHTWPDNTNVQEYERNR